MALHHSAWYMKIFCYYSNGYQKYVRCMGHKTETQYFKDFWKYMQIPFYGMYAISIVIYHIKKKMLRGKLFTKYISVK